MATVFVKQDEKNIENLDTVHIIKSHDNSPHSSHLTYGDSLKPITDEILLLEDDEIRAQNLDDIREVEHKHNGDYHRKLTLSYNFTATTATSSLTSRRLSFASSTNCNFSKHELSEINMKHEIAQQESQSQSQSIETIEEYYEPLSDADTSCIGKDIDNCIGLQRILSLLLFYASHYDKYEALNDYLTKYNLKTHLINDYHHILDKHLNDETVSKKKIQKQFELIYHEMVDINGLFCDICSCEIFARHHRRRETSQIKMEDEQLAVFVDILDTIHCYFMHCVDLGHRMIGSQYKRYIAGASVNLSELRPYLENNDAIKMRAISGMKDDRFVTKLKQSSSKMCGYLRKESLYLKQIRLRYIVLEDNHLYSYKSEKCVELTESIDLNEYSYVCISEHGPIGEFELISVSATVKKRVFIAECMRELDLWLSALKPVMMNKHKIHSAEALAHQHHTHSHFGERFDYWSNDSAYPKYESIREELTNNTIFRISREAFECAFNKAIYLHNCHKIRNMMSCRDVIDKYAIRYDATPRVEHILAVILWCDYRVLSAVFKSQFNFISKKIYDEFWIWSKYLIECVNTFGSRLKKSKHKICYHLMDIAQSNNNYLEYVSMFNAPIACSTQASVALLKQNSATGIVLEFTNYKKLRYFNCSFVSYFATESERLFISPPFCDKHLNYFAHILSIYDVECDANYAQYIEPLNILKQLFNNEVMTMTNSASIDGCKYLLSILLSQNDEDECPPYVCYALHEWSESVANIRFNSYLNNKIVCDVDLYCQNIEYLIRFDKLNLMFKQLETIQIDKQLDSIYLNDIDFGPEPLGYHDNSTCIASMLSMLDTINELNYSKLRQISIECNHEMEIHHWIQYKQLIVDKKWQIDVYDASDDDDDDDANDENTSSKIIKITRTQT